MTDPERGERAKSVDDARGDLGLTDEDMPELFASADRASAAAQRSFLRLTRVQLTLLVVAALTGAISGAVAPSHLKELQAVSAVAFLLLVALRVTQRINKTDQKWYEGRAVAESAKTLAWRYAVRGDPLGTDLSSAEVDELFVDRLDGLLEPIKVVTLVPSPEGQEITQRLRDLRESPLPARRDAYTRGRVNDQRAWYARKAAWNARQASWWFVAGLVFEGLGFVFAVLVLSGNLTAPWSVQGLAATLVGVTTTWSQTKQFQNLASAYSVTARELTSVHDSSPIKRMNGRGRGSCMTPRRRYPASTPYGGHHAERDPGHGCAVDYFALAERPSHPER